MSFVLSSISGNLISAASAGYAPTNSGDVSAIASAFAESAASGKLDASASSSFYSTANESGFVGSAYVDSAVSGKQDTLAFAWAADSSISSINGSALAGGAAITAISYDTATQETSVVTATGIGIADSASNPRVSSIWFSDGSYRPIEASAITVGTTQTGQNGDVIYTLKFSPSASMWTTSDMATGIFSPLQWGTGAGVFMDAGWFKGFVKGNELFVSNTGLGRAAQLEVNHLGLSSNNGSSRTDLYNSALNIVNSAKSTAILNQTGLTVKYSSHLSGNLNYAGMYFSKGSTRPYNIGIDNTGGNFYIATAQNGYERIYASSIQGWNAKLDGSASSSFYTTANESGFVDSAYVTGAITGKQDTLAFGYNAANQISSIDGSALGGMDEAAVSSIASSYAESAASGKLDSTAFNSADFYSTANPSGFITGVDLGEYATTGYVDSSVSGKLDSTAFNSADFYSTSNPSGFITGVDLTPYQEKSAMTAYQPSGDYYSASNPSGFITGVDLSNYATTGYVDSSVSGKLDTTAFNSGDFYSTANPSGFLTGVDLTPYQTTAGMSAYQPSGDYYSAGNPSGFISSLGPITNAELVTALPSSAVAGTLYLIPE